MDIAGMAGLVELHDIQLSTHFFSLWHYIDRPVRSEKGLFSDNPSNDFFCHSTAKHV